MIPHALVYNSLILSRVSFHSYLQSTSCCSSHSQSLAHFWQFSCSCYHRGREEGWLTHFQDNGFIELGLALCTWTCAQPSLFGTEAEPLSVCTGLLFTQQAMKSTVEHIIIISRWFSNNLFHIYACQILVVSACKDSVELTSKRATRLKPLEKELDFSPACIQKDAAESSSALLELWLRRPHHDNPSIYIITDPHSYGNLKNMP